MIQYVKDTQRTALPHIRSLTWDRQDQSVILDAATRRNLELTHNLAGGTDNTLAEVLDHCATPMGSRMLKRWIHQPMRDNATLNQRLDAITELKETALYGELHPVLKQIGDIERILARLALRSARPRDLARLRHAMQQLPELHSVMSELKQPHLTELRTHAEPMDELCDLLERAIKENPPVVIRDGGVIADGYSAELDEWRDLANGATEFLERLEAEERDRHGIDTLKVGYNNVHGFYIQVSRGQSHLVPPHYVRRQTLKNAERYIIEELKQHEDKVLNSKSRALALEKQLWEELFDLLMPHLEQLQQLAASVAQLDVLQNLAERAENLEYCRPTLVQEAGIHIQGGRHPVVERVMNEPFIANPIELNPQRRMLIITGPNMGGKSTYMRQTALIALMAHIGSYVPAESASIGPLDRIFTRIGASDDLASGRSTFMVEMTETANILHNATRNSLVLMDEIGRGTSTYDGLSLAWASAEWLAKEIGAMTLFATHYFELTELPNVLPHLANVHLDAVEHGDGIAFMHAVQEGAASKSYGLAVAGLAGVPKPVIKNARAKLQQLELLSSQPAETRKPSRVDIANQLSLIPEPSAVEQALAGVDPDQLTPRQALDMLYQLKKLL
ncbi:DNA mismatch repair protein MutS [Vibrio cholerae]|nr:DNA mismatch repair protein MutS [Vibrio cholerae]